MTTVAVIGKNYVDFALVTTITMTIGAVAKNYVDYAVVTTIVMKTGAVIKKVCWFCCSNYYNCWSYRRGYFLYWQ